MPPSATVVQREILILFRGTPNRLASAQSKSRKKTQQAVKQSVPIARFEE